MAHSSSISLPRVGDDDGSPGRRLLRLRADERFREMMRSDAQGRVAYIDVPSREAISVGETIRLEISFGALSDEVELEGQVEAVEPGPQGRPPRVVIRLGQDHLARAHYVRAVLNGARPASARSHRRIPTDLACRWSSGAFEHTSRIRDLSRGGAFIMSHFSPAIGTRLDVRFDEGADRLRVEGVVTWIRSEGREAGFGVSFKVRDRRLAERLFRVLRSQERPISLR